MDHDETREQLELAAAEPGGLDRLMAGDTATAQIVAAHLAGCLSCTEELARLDRASRVIRHVVREQPPADLRDRTLAAVRAAGAPRGSVPATKEPAPTPIATGAVGRGDRRARTLGWVAAIAAAVVVSVVATTTYIDSRVDERLAGQSATIRALEDVTAATLVVTAEPDARRVALSAPDPELRGTLVFSPSTAELVVVATGLTPPPAGQEYRCWVERDGDRERVGLMFFSDGLAYWVGPVEAVQGLSGEGRFGVALVTLDGSVDSVDVLTGDL
jgi:hypothetical protein